MQPKTTTTTGATVLALLCAAVLAACGGGDGVGNPDSKLTPDQAKAPLADAPAPLTGVRAQANQLLEGGPEAFEARLAELRGHPVVVNKWASWCGPCRLEFPFFQSQAVERGAEVAFIGVNSNDSEAAASTFLDELPLPFPSYRDPDSKIAELIGSPVNFPATAFYDRAGKLVFTRPGAYRNEAELAADIEIYAR